MRATKSIKQSIPPNNDLDNMMEIFRDMMNHCIRIGIRENCSTLKRMSILSYHELRDYDILSSYKLNAMSQACGILAKYKKEFKKNPNISIPYVTRPYIINCYGI